MSHSFFASCPKGLELLLCQELEQLGASELKETVAGVAFSGSLEVGYRACLWSRLANRILLILGEYESNNRDTLYAGIKQVEWLAHMGPKSSFAIDFRGTNEEIRNSHFGAMVAKDAIVDQIRDLTGERPIVNAQKPDVRISVRLAKGKATVAIDLSGDSLHQRGYRLDEGKAPLKENLAAALLLRAGWPALAQEGQALVDPMCGSGTLVIEAALMAADIAPGLLRVRFGFQRWLGHQQSLWLELLEEANQRRREGLRREPLWIRGWDADSRVISKARQNIERAGLARWVKVAQGELAQFKPSPNQGQTGLLITNPPYGERLGDEASLVYLYQCLGRQAKRYCGGWQAAVFTSNQGLVRQLGMRSHKNYRFFNGSLACNLYLYQISARSEQSATESAQSVGEATAPVTLSAGAQMFANRLRKNIKGLGKWVRQQGVSCYRLYDADIPEYAVAVDRYNDYVHVQEYKAPASVDEDKAQQRLFDVLAAVQDVLDVKPENIVLKQRRRQAGKEQYRKQANRTELLEVEEAGCKLLVNLHDYLDTGLFIDHRRMRQRIQQEAKGKRFLNLFCYTGTATVHAACGGAETTVSVDLSNTYLDWARRNLLLNGFSDRHELVRADCGEWLKANTRQFDLIFMDPPTFSNSKKMRGVLDVQRDHPELIQRAMAALAKDGVLYFSNNYRQFKISDELLERYHIEEITHATIDRDFQRKKPIHRSWRISHRV